MVAATRSLLLAMSISAGASSCAEVYTLTINRPGTHIIEGDLTGTGVVVMIAANDVVLDLNGKTIRCQPGDPATATIGLSARHRSSVTIRNGAITGCRFGIVADHANGVVIEDVNLSGNTYVGAELYSGQRNIVRRSRFDSISGHIPGVYSFGVNGIGSQGLIEHNTFTDLYRQPGASGVGEGVGIVVEEGATAVVVRDNTFSNRQCRANTIGVWSAIGAQTEAVRNTVTNFEHGVQGDKLTAAGNTFSVTSPFPGSVAILANSGSASANVVNGYEKAIDGGIADAGGHSVNAIVQGAPPCR